MKPKIKQIVIFAVVIALVSSSSIVYAERTRDFQKNKTERLIEKLDLSLEQQEQLREQRAKNEEKAKGLKKRLRSKRSELSEELEKEDIDKQKVYSVITEVETLMGDQLEQRVERILTMREILTPEQFKKLREKKGRGHRKR